MSAPRCDRCTRRARGVWLLQEPETTYTRNGAPADGERVEACGKPCARAAVYGRHRVPAGVSLRRVESFR